MPWTLMRRFTSLIAASESVITGAWVSVFVVSIERSFSYLGSAFFLWSDNAALIASSARTEQWIFTGGRFSSCTMSVFLIFWASPIVLPFHHSVARLALALA